ncbi:CHASE2 domain-containing protein [Desulfovibrio aerotolerans]|uniref:CHASE2 domain-containing protein n=1 Tax=Solidesulfovibrio aerotolerans TaxID=295255 RepID=A0A7C9IV10_9BACT|nr:CHASE2 domain-containing protein [Solidesulfovibrio aerotolerans]MYL84260.1 CHASE2 domain-containing protein [Solidesulfovibrio aerotolerans]
MGFRFNTIFSLAVIQSWVDQIEKWCLLHFWYHLACRYLGRFVPKSIKNRWNKLKNFPKLILKNLTIGLFIAILLHGLHAAGFLRNNLRWALDWTMTINAGTNYGAGVTADSAKKLYTFVNIDESLFQEWGEPLFTPRDKVAELLSNIVEGGAGLVIVDIDLTRPSPDPRQDAALSKYLAEPLTAAAGARPPVILVKSMRRSGWGNTDLPQFRESFLDSVVSQTPNLYWASPMFAVDEDQLIRYWRLVECSTTAKGPQALPSAQLLTYALLTPGEAPGSTLYGILDAQLDKVKGLCVTNDGRETAAKALAVGALTFPLLEKTVENRILYSLKPDTPSPTVSVNDAVKPVLLSIPARTLLDPGSGQRLRDLLKGRIVILGGSYADSFDTHATPIGTMPGSMIILNAIRSLFLYGIVHEPSLWTTIAVEAILIVVMTTSFMLFRTFVGMLLSCAFIFVLLVPISMAVLRYGVWLDFAMPLIAVQLHHMAEEFEKKHEEYEKKLWSLP